MKILTITILTLSALVGGCAKNDRTPVVQTQAASLLDPKTSFEDMLRTAAVLEASEKLEHWEGVTYDIRKTDSLVTPYEAELKLSEIYVANFQRTDYSAKFGYRDGKWSILKLRSVLLAKNPDWDVIHDTLPDESSPAWINFARRLGLPKQ